MSIWRPMKELPKEYTTGYPIKHLQLVDEKGNIYPDCHYADSDGEGYQPGFKGWFYPVYTNQFDEHTRKIVKRVSFYAEVVNPVKWALRKQDDPQYDMFEEGV